jgi:hypothetical protein
MNQAAAIYARVSSDRQKENQTIASQTAALLEYAQANGYAVPPEWVFEDEGYSGAVWRGPVWKLCATWRRKARSERPWSMLRTG